MAKIIKGKHTGRGKKIAVVVSRFNEFITSNLLDGCLDELKKLGVRNNDVTVAWVPGAYEIPITALKFAEKRNINAVICLGAVIRGETYHFELVSQGVAKGILDISLDIGKPVIFGVLTTETVSQAYKRSEEDGDNKGREAAVSAVEIIDVLSKIK